VQISGYLEKCCLLLSANESYERSAQNIEMSLDGGKVCLRTRLGEPCIWKDYKAIRRHDLTTVAYFMDNAGLIAWVNRQTLNTPFFALGDGHDGIWNVFAEIGPSKHRCEILVRLWRGKALWFYLVENLYHVPGSLKRLQNVEDFLRQGNVDIAIAQFAGCHSGEAQRFVWYLNKHRTRIPNYEYLHQEGFSIGSGEKEVCRGKLSPDTFRVESAIKQIGRRVKISGAQWDEKNVPQLLKHRCAYLNGYFSTAPQSIQ
jgi:hypothetical protein